MVVLSFLLLSGCSVRHSDGWFLTFYFLFLEVRGGGCLDINLLFIFL